MINKTINLLEEQNLLKVEDKKEMADDDLPITAALPPAPPGREPGEDTNGEPEDTSGELENLSEPSLAQSISNSKLKIAKVLCMYRFMLTIQNKIALP